MHGFETLDPRLISRYDNLPYAKQKPQVFIRSVLPRSGTSAPHKIKACPKEQSEGVWACMDSDHGPPTYKIGALTN